MGVVFCGGVVSAAVHCFFLLFPPPGLCGSREISRADWRETFLVEISFLCIDRICSSPGAEIGIDPDSSFRELYRLSAICERADLSSGSLPVLLRGEGHCRTVPGDGSSMDGHGTEGVEAGSAP